MFQDDKIKNFLGQPFFFISRVGLLERSESGHCPVFPPTSQPLKKGLKDDRFIYICQSVGNRFLFQ